MSFIELEKKINETANKVDVILDTLLALREEKKQSKTNEIPPICTVEEAIEILDISRTAFNNKRKNGELSVMVQGRRVYITREELMRYLTASDKKFVTDNSKKTTKK